MVKTCLSQKNELTENGSLVCGRKAGHDSHEKDGHVQHGGDAQGDLLTRLRRDQEHKPDQQDNKKRITFSPLRENTNVTRWYSIGKFKIYPLPWGGTEAWFPW